VSKKKGDGREYAASNVQAAIESLDQAAKKPQMIRNTERAVGMMFGAIESCLAQGYTFEQVSQIVRSRGIEIDPARLREFIEAERPREAARRRESAKTASARDKHARRGAKKTRVNTGEGLGDDLGRKVDTFSSEDLASL
jgi:hypothetical protein